MDNFSLQFYSLALVSLLAPGFFISLKITLNCNAPTKLLLSIAISYSLYALSFIASNHQKVDSAFFNYAYLAMVILSTLLSLRSIEKQKTINFIRSSFLKDVLLIFASITLYHFMTGPYDQLPADVYNHLTRYQFAIGKQLEGNLGASLPLTQLLLQKGAVWYHFVATIQWHIDISTQEVLFNTTLLTKTIFLIAIYSFGRVIFQGNENCRSISLVSTFFIAAHLGISVFSYLRYYSFAPTMLAYVLFLASIAFFIERCNNYPKKIFDTTLWGIIVILMLAMGSIHVQEAVFTATIVFLISVVSTFKLLTSRSPSTSITQHHTITCLGIIIFIGLYFYASTHLNRNPNIGHRLWDFGEISHSLPRLTVLNAKYQFLQVITLWGLLIYSLSLVFWKKIYDNNYLLAGMLLPIFTVFNPFFIDLFLRVYTSTVLYRMLYITPIHFVGALITVHLLHQLFKKNLIIFKSVTIFFVSLILILPFISPNQHSALHSSRLPTLKPVNKNEGFERYSDLTQFLNTIEKTQIITDPITGFFIAGATQHRYFRKNFLQNHLKFTFKDYSESPLSRFSGMTLIINLREPSNSLVGKLGRHWPANIFNVNHYYPVQLLQHLRDSPARFELIWSSNNNDLLIYNIN